MKETNTPKHTKQKETPAITYPSTEYQTIQLLQEIVEQFKAANNTLEEMQDTLHDLTERGSNF